MTKQQIDILWEIDRITIKSIAKKFGIKLSVLQKEIEVLFKNNYIRESNAKDGKYVTTFNGRWLLITKRIAND